MRSVREGDAAIHRSHTPGRSVMDVHGPSSMAQEPLSKRVFDVVVAGIALILVAPLGVLLTLGILLESPGPVIFSCTRVGRGGREFRMLKFRKMHRHASGPPLTAARDARFTRVGRFLAATRLDELPQLVNVLRGDMSLVGPRPEDPQFVALAAAEYARILQVRPGLTGLSQLAFARESRILDRPNAMEYYVTRLLPAKAQLDILYASRLRLLTDLRIILWTIVAVGTRKELAVRRSTGQIGLRRRPVGVPVPSPVAGR